MLRARLMFVLLMCCEPLLADPIALNTHTFSATVAKNNVLVLFHTSWCKTCRPVRETFQQLSQLRREGVLIGVLDAEAQRSVAHKEGVRSYPSIFLYRHGRREQYIGKRGYADLLNFLNSSL
jgi:thiol-disulfide isomerase/thioredoxin